PLQCFAIALPPPAITDTQPRIITHRRPVQRMRSILSAAHLASSHYFSRLPRANQPSPPLQCLPVNRSTAYQHSVHMLPTRLYIFRRRLEFAIEATLELTHMQSRAEVSKMQ